MHNKTVLSLGAAILLLPAVAQAQDSERWNWSKQLPSGQIVEIRGVNGSISATAATGSEVQVRAAKHADRSDVSDVKLVVLEHDAGVTICAVYPSGDRSPNECKRGGGRNNVRNNDVRVDFEVQLPRGVRLIAQTVNGNVRATGLQSDVAANTVNGNIEASTSGLVSAKTVNGSIDARIGRSDWRDELALETVNGNVTLEVAGEVNADVSASTVTGGIETDFPLTVSGRFGPKNVSGTIGNGGRKLSLTTVNGDLEIRSVRRTGS